MNAQLEIEEMNISLDSTELKVINYETRKKNEHSES